MISRARCPSNLQDAVETFLCRMSPDDTRILLAVEREDLPDCTDAFIRYLEQTMHLKEKDLVRLCGADDLEGAAALFMEAAWSKARTRRIN
jgi:hypothetical protein